MVSNTILPPVFVPPVQDSEREQAPARKQATMANSFQREKTAGPTSAYGEVAAMSVEDNRGRLLDLYV